MKLKERLKNAGFWVSIISSVFLILGAFGIEIADETASSVINAVCSALVVFGIVSDPTTGKGYLDAAKLAGDSGTLVGATADSVTAIIDETDVRDDNSGAPQVDAATEGNDTKNSKDNVRSGE